MPPTSTPDGEYSECHACDGTGEDEQDVVFGLCWRCGGIGEVFVAYDREEDDE